MLQEAVNCLYAPTCGTGDAEGRTRATHGDDAMVRTIARIEGERRDLEREIRVVKENEEKLNRYLREICALPTFERRIIVGVYIDGKTPDVVCKDIGKSDETLDRYRKTAIRKMVRSLYRIETKGWTKEDV